MLLALGAALPIVPRSPGTTTCRTPWSGYNGALLWTLLVLSLVLRKWVLVCACSFQAIRLLVRRILSEVLLTRTCELGIPGIHSRLEGSEARSLSRVIEGRASDDHLLRVWKPLLVTCTCWCRSGLVERSRRRRKGMSLSAGLVIL